MNRKIILASASPRRKELLANIGLEFDVIPSDFDENIEGKTFSYELIEDLAWQKVLGICKHVDYSALVIGSDTVVVTDDKILGKPKNNQDAYNMLKSLSGNTHKVISAIVIHDTDSSKTIKTSVTSEVIFRTLEDREIQAYIKTGEPSDKAGAYAIQGKAGIFVKEIKGCYSNIVGISVYKVAEMLKEFGVNVL